MKILSLTLLFILAFNSIGRSQSRPRVKLSADRNHAIAVYNLEAAEVTCDKPQIPGTIVNVTYDRRTGTEIAGFALALKDGTRKFISIDPNAINSMSNADRGWLPYIIHKGNRVRVDVNICGSGAFFSARNIFVISSKG